MNFEVNGYNIFIIVAVCFLSSLIFVQIMKKVAIFLKVLDVPNDPRKIHKKPMPLLGGLGIFFAFLLGYMLFAPKNNLMIAVLIGSLLIMLLGLFDDMTKSETPMPNKYKVIVQLIVAAIVVFYGGLELTKITLFGMTITFTSIPFLSEFLSILIIQRFCPIVNRKMQNFKSAGRLSPLKYTIYLQNVNTRGALLCYYLYSL